MHCLRMQDIEQQKVGKPENHETISSKWYGTLSKPENKGFKRKCRQPRLNFEAMLSATGTSQWSYII